MTNAIREIKGVDGIQRLVQEASSYRLVRKGHCEEAILRRGLKKQICKNLEEAHRRRETARAKAPRQENELGVFEEQKKSGWRLVSLWDMVTHASGKTQKSQMLQGLVAHSEGF